MFVFAISEFLTIKINIILNVLFVMSDTIQNRCRICLDIGLNHVSILGDPTIYLQIKSCLSLNIITSDDLPKKICSSCVSQLREFYNFQLTAKCSADWLESTINSKKKTEAKLHVQPLPDSEYNSDSLLEFLNNTANIEDYLNNLGREDIPSIVTMLDRTAEVSPDKLTLNQKTKQPSPKKRETKQKCLNMDIDVLDSDIEIVQEILMKETDPQKGHLKYTEEKQTCFGCSESLDTMQKLSQHLSICDMASRTCIHCYILFDSKAKLKQHSLIHGVSDLTCNCGKKFEHREAYLQHYKHCNVDYIASMGYIHRCKECGESFPDRFHLYRHVQQHIVTAQKRICDICGHSFMGDEELHKHKKDEHDILQGFMYKCKLCSLTGSNRKEMYLHIQRHLELQQAHRHLCEHCGKSFSTNTTLVRHVQQHTATQQQRCNLCNTTFNNKNSLEQHTREHNETSMCDRCGLNVLGNNFSVHHCN